MNNRETRGERKVLDRSEMCLEGCNRNERILFIGDLNVKLGDKRIERAVGAYRVPGVNGTRRALVDLCVSKKKNKSNQYIF